ncbi:MAG TPA: hypothetical protein VGP72_21045 [Planctomycetota bacterium]|jgi:hypothetical protein
MFETAAGSATVPAYDRKIFLKIAAIAWWVLLSGYLVFNRPFATIGTHPLYIGEAILGLSLLALLVFKRSAFIEPLRRSWTFRFICAFLIYGLARAAWDYSFFGFYALRDSAIAYYAIAAFVAPALWSELSGPAVVRNETVSQAPVFRAAHWLLPTTILAAAWGFSILRGWAPPEMIDGIKVDLMSAAVLIGAWVWGLRIADCRLRIAALLISLASLAVVLAYPVRTTWLAIGPLLVAGVAAFCWTRGRRIALLSACLGLALLAIPSVTKIATAFARVDRDFGLKNTLAFSTQERELYLRDHPDHFTKMKLTYTPDTSAEGARERLKALVVLDAREFKTESGQSAAYSTVWRATFWTRCVRYTLRNSPLTGIGFGFNLTNLLRFTAGWYLFVDSQRLDPPNRSPHCAHITVFTRMGLIGFALWLSILISVGWGTLKRLWDCRQRYVTQKDSYARTEFYATLAIFGVWVVFLWSMSFGVILEGPMGGMWFWGLTGALAHGESGVWKSGVWSQQQR